MTAQRIISLDAGKRRVYGALSFNGRTCSALHGFDPEECLDIVDMTHPTIKPGFTPISEFTPFDLAVLERQNINRNTPNWQSTLDCERAGQRVAGRLRCPVVEYTAAQWKGGIKKPQHHLHLWRILNPDERSLFTEDTFEIIRKACEMLAKTGDVKNYSFKDNNFLDALALFKFHTGQLGRGGAKVK
jgi:hypothetical protein